MATKKSSMRAGAVLAFLGSLIYLYIVWVWYSTGAALGPWVSAASFLGPFVIAVAVFSAISLFFMSLGAMAGMGGGDAKMMNDWLWKIVMWASITFIILGGAAWFVWVLVAIILTYLGAAWEAMM